MGLDSQGGLCDTFALRDSKGHGPIMPSFPYFRSKASRRAVLAEEAIPVQSCWGGMGKFCHLFLSSFLLLGPFRDKIHNGKILSRNLST